MLKTSVTHTRCLRCQGLLVTQFGIQEGDRVVCMKCSRESYVAQMRPVIRNDSTESVTVTYGGTQTMKSYVINVFYKLIKIDGDPFIKIISVKPMHKYHRARGEGKNLKIRAKHHQRIRGQIYQKRGVKVMADDDFFPIL